MVKDKDILEKAYNDSKGVTARFNLNILNVANNLAGTNFDLREFEHSAFYNENSSCIEMHLKALKDLEISSPHLPENLVIAQGETIHTENSHKFRDEHIKDMANTAGLEITNQFTDEKHWFSLVQFHKQRR
jgi:L-histidine N-alpha-methyltransferase